MADPIRKALERLVRDIEYLADHSSGVVELHQNGDLAPWAELLEQGAYSCWLGDALAEAHAALDATPLAPAAGEVGELVKELEVAAVTVEGAGGNHEAAAVRRAAALLEQQHARIAELEAERLRLKPVPVGEPVGPGDCDAEGRCWWFIPASVLPNGTCPCWCLTPAESPRSWFTHWLPFNALPIPQQEAQQ